MGMVGGLFQRRERLVQIALFTLVLMCYTYVLLPFRLGEVLRAYVLWRKEGINVGTTLTTAVLERLFDGLTMVLFVLFGFMFMPLSAFLGRLVTVASAAFFGALVVFLFLAAQPDLLRRVAHVLIGRLVPARVQPPVLGLVEGIVAGLESLRSGRDVLVADQPADLAVACLRVLNAPDLGVHLARNGRILAEQKYDYRYACVPLDEIYAKVKKL